MPPRPQPRLPLAPLMRAAGTENRTHLSELLGVSSRKLARWIAKGGVPLREADRLAVGLGRHPGELWGDEWWRQDRIDVLFAGLAVELRRMLAEAAVAAEFAWRDEQRARQHDYEPPSCSDACRAPHISEAAA